MTTVLVTGGAGFIGSNFVHYIAKKYPDYRVVVLDALTYAGSTDNLAREMRQIDHPRMRFWYGDVVNAELVNTLVAEADYVVHFAAETHVTRSIFDNRLFFQTDVMGAHTVANAVLKSNGRVKRFVHISSSEVYGTAEKPYDGRRASAQAEQYATEPVDYIHRQGVNRTPAAILLYCAGVDRAVETVERALERHGAPVYVRARRSCTTRHVVDTLSRGGRGLRRRKPTRCPEGAIVVFSAHGVAPDGAHHERTDRKLQVIDATCPLVTKVHNEAKRFARRRLRHPADRSRGPRGGRRHRRARRPTTSARRRNPPTQVDDRRACETRREVASAVARPH